jgi:cyclin C
MEFYLLEDLDFHLIVFHPYRSLLAICGREASDAGTFTQTRIEEDTEILKVEADARKKRDEEIRKAGPGARGQVDEPGPEEESEEARVIRLMRRGTGEGLMEIEESVLQISM